MFRARTFSISISIFRARKAGLDSLCAEVFNFRWKGRRCLRWGLGSTMRSAMFVAAFCAASAASAPAWCLVVEIAPNGDVIVLSDDETPEPSPRSRSSDSRLEALQSSFIDAADDADLSPRLLEAVAWAESRFDAAAVSPKGAIGVMQLMPQTASRLGVDPHVANENIAGGAAYLRTLLQRFDGDIALALAAYNAGPGAVEHYGGMPPYAETQQFVDAVLGYLASASSEGE